jgi:predicted nucleic acid-binding protein
VGAGILTTLDAALARVTALGIDTAPFIYFIERDPAHFAVMREVFRRVEAGNLQACSSTITLTEVLVKPRQSQRADLARAYREILLRSRNLSLVSIDASIAEVGADLRARYGLRTPDALQVAAAVATGCEAFLTNDAALRCVAEIRVLTLTDLVQ